MNHPVSTIETILEAPLVSLPGIGPKLAVLLEQATGGKRILDLLLHLPERFAERVAVPGPEAAALAGRSVMAFCGIANPQKFFATLAEAGAILAGRAAFADHYPFDDGDMEALLKEAASLRATPVTTRKDFVRIPEKFRAAVTVVTVALEWDESSQIEELLEPLAHGMPLAL